MVEEIIKNGKYIYKGNMSGIFKYPTLFVATANGFIADNPSPPYNRIIIPLKDILISEWELEMNPRNKIEYLQPFLK